MDEHAVNEWLTRYVAAWKSYDRDEIMALFTEDAQYRYHPYDGEPVVGNAAIATAWVEPDQIDEPGTYDAHYEAFVVSGDKAVAIGESIYRTTDGTTRAIYDNCYLLRFAADGRCSSFTEWFMKRPG